MIIRSGFVSNSSSSSFLIRIPKDGIIDNYKEYFGINEKDPIKLLEKTVGLGTVVLRAVRDSDTYYENEILTDSETLVDYYKDYYKDNETFNRLVYELNHPDEFPNTEVIAFEANDNEGNIVDYDVTYSLSNPRDGDFTSSNIVVFNEH